MENKFRCIAAGLFAFLSCSFAQSQSQSQSQSNTDFNIVLISDTTMVMVRTTDTEMFKGRYISAQERTGNFLGSEKLRAGRVFNYAVDCKIPRKIALILSEFNLETKPDAEPRWAHRFEKAEYEKGVQLETLNYRPLPEFNESRAKIIEDKIGHRLKSSSPLSPNLVVEYACAVAGTKTPAKVIASKLEKFGGISTLKELSCDINFRGGNNMVTTVRFDDDLGFVQVNDKWKLNPFVNSQTIGYVDSEGAITQINRNNGKLSITPKEGEPYATGICDVSKNTIKKF